MLLALCLWGLPAMAVVAHSNLSSEVATKVAPATGPTPTLKVSSDGTCGQGITCLGSSYGPCCSEHFYCGSADAYCGAKCHPDFGDCNKSGLSILSPASTICISVATRTTVERIVLTVQLTETTTQLSISTSTVTSTLVVPGTYTITETLQTTKTRTATTTATYYVLSSTTVVDRSTSTIISTMTTTASPNRTKTAISPSMTFAGTASDCTPSDPKPAASVSPDANDTLKALNGTNCVVTRRARTSRQQAD